MPPLSHKDLLARLPSELRFNSAFEAYVAFKSLPEFLRYPPKDRKAGYRPSPREFAEGIGIDDETLLSLIELKTQKGFADRFGVTEQTLVRWNEKIAKRDSLKDMEWWTRRLTPNVALMHYMRILQGDALPNHFKLWYQVFMGWSEKQLHQVNARTVRRVRVEIVDAAAVSAKKEPPLVYLKKRAV